MDQKLGHPLQIWLAIHIRTAQFVGMPTDIQAGVVAFTSRTIPLSTPSHKASQHVIGFWRKAQPIILKVCSTFDSTDAGNIETLFTDLAAELASCRIKRMVVASGATSGAVVTGVRAQTLHIGPETR